MDTKGGCCHNINFAFVLEISINYPHVVQQIEPYFFSHHYPPTIPLLALKQSWDFL